MRARSRDCEIIPGYVRVSFRETQVGQMPEESIQVLYPEWFNMLPAGD